MSIELLLPPQQQVNAPAHGCFHGFLLLYIGARLLVQFCFQCTSTPTGVAAFSFLFSRPRETRLAWRQPVVIQCKSRTGNLVRLSELPTVQLAPMLSSSSRFRGRFYCLHCIILCSDRFRSRSTDGEIILLSC